jgi:Rrf2 family protein
MAMADLAKYGADGALPLPAIAERQQISLAYLEQLFLKLRRAGLVESARGRSGGYRLGRPAATISVADVMAAVEEDTRMTRCGGGSQALPARPALPHPRAVGRARRPDRGLPGERHLQEVLDGIPAGKHGGRAAGNLWTICPSLRVGQWAADEPGAHISRLERDGAVAPEARAPWLRRSMCRQPVFPMPRAARGPHRDAREQVAAFVGAKPAEVVFTSGGRKPTTPSWLAVGVRSWLPASSTIRCWRDAQLRRAPSTSP